MAHVCHQPQFWMLCLYILFSEMSMVFQEQPEACPHLLRCKIRTGPWSLRALDLPPQHTDNLSPEPCEQCLFSLNRFGQNFKILKRKGAPFWLFPGRCPFTAPFAAQGGRFRPYMVRPPAQHRPRGHSRQAASAGSRIRSLCRFTAMNDHRSLQ